jgi:hypothetical protein
MPIGKKKARELLAEAKEARRAATMQKMSVGWPGETISKAGTFAGFEDGVTTPDEYIREKTRLFRESWIIGPLDRIIAELERASK